MTKRTLTLILAILIVVLVGCNEECCERVGFTATALSGSDIENAGNEYIARVGAAIENTEVGITAHYWPDNDIDEAYGIYALQTLVDPNNGLWLIGRPYIGAQATIDDGQGDGGMYGFITGTVVDIGGIDVLAEFQWRSYSAAMREEHDDESDEFKAFVGPRFRF